MDNWLLAVIRHCAGASLISLLTLAYSPATGPAAIMMQCGSQNPTSGA
jgi:hypothetical protein